MIETPTLLQSVWMYACWGVLGLFWLAGAALLVWCIYLLVRRFLRIFFDVNV